ncbi:hypothetical protein [Stenotrophomonas maltophilia]|uniref:hypothetical protein n=1 Tax=Stenotrophomonas maltophilia TaxID=40324 RepID=UPI0039C021BD
MSTDKTLADVQPGGRVRLGDQALSTSEGARRYVADFFAKQLRCHDFGNYILTELAADFACELAQHLSAQPSPGGQGDARALAEHITDHLCPHEYDIGGRPELLACVVEALADRQPVKGLSWADYWMERGQPDAAHDFDAFSRAEAWALQRFPDASQPVGLPLTLCRDSYPPLVAHSSSYGGVWTSDWCLVVDLNGSTCSARYQVSDFDKRSMDANGGVPNAVQNDPWRVPGFGHVVAWAKASDVVAHISRSTDAAPPAQVVDLDAVRALLQRRIEQWRSHPPADPGAPGTREIETKGEHDYNNDVRIYREGIAVMEEVLSKIDSQAVGK